jgi:acetolactate synthase-1/2/3 large subunit
MTQMTGGQALVRSMQREGIRVVFGIPGAGQYEAVDALWESPDIDYYAVRHEQAATYMADGYARAGGRIAGAIVISGPGIFNALSGMATADDLSSPMLVITGDHNFRDYDGTDESQWFSRVARWTSHVGRPADMPGVVQESMRRMRTGRPGPVLLEVPWKTLAAVEDVELLEPEVYGPDAPDAGLVLRAAALLRDSTAPVIWAGGGVHTSGASEAVITLAEHLGAPVVSSANGKGAIPDSHPLSLGLAELRYEPLREWLEGRDVILAVGTRNGFEGRTPGQKLVRIDIDPAQTGGDVTVTGDAAVTLEELLRELQSSRRESESPAAEVAALSKDRFAPHNQLEPQRSLINAVREAVPDDGIIVQGMNQMGYYSRNYLPVYASRTYLTASHHGTLGYAFPVGIGAKIAQPDRAVVVISGDGGFLYNSQELATAVQYGINIVVVVFNDNAYGNVLRAQEEEFDGHVLGTRLHNPEFAALARTYGARGVNVNGAAQLKVALDEALVADTPTLIEVPLGRLDRVY